MREFDDLDKAISLSLIGAMVIWFLVAQFFLTGCQISIPKDITVHCDNCPVSPVDPTPTDPVKPPPVSALSFKGIKNGILDTYCLKCHVPGGQASFADFTSYKNVMQFVVPGNPGASKLCQRPLDGSMPPGSPLTKTQIDTLCKWIEQGAKES